MNKTDVIRAWKDPFYRATLTSDQLALLPAHPAGLVELDEDHLRAAGAIVGPVQTTAPECTLYTFLNWRACGCPR